MWEEKERVAHGAFRAIVQTMAMAMGGRDGNREKRSQNAETRDSRAQVQTGTDPGTGIGDKENESGRREDELSQLGH